MKKITYLLTLLLLTAFSYGQVANYTFSQSTGTYTPITGGTLHGTAADDANYSFTLPFTFTYNGTGYTAARPTSNGFLVLGGNAPSTTNYTPLSSGSTNFAIAAMARDLNSTIRSEVIGTSPNRIYVCQWSSAYRYAVGSAGDNLNAQVRLYEGTNRIEIVYGTFTTTNTTLTTGPIQVGLRGSATTDYNNRTTTTNWTSTTAGTSNSATCAGTTTVSPSSGLTFSWSPPVASTSPNCIALPTTPANNATGVTSRTFTWPAATGLPTGYKLYVGTDVGATNLINGLDIGAVTTYDASALITYSANTVYYWSAVPYNGFGDAAGCAIWSFTSATVPNCVTTTVPADAATNIARNPTLTWTAPTGTVATSYDVYFGTAANPPLIGNQTTLSYTPGLLLASTTYYWRIVPKNGVGAAVGCTDRTFVTGTSFSYCAPTYTSGAGTTDGITNVTLGSLNNTSTQNNVSPYYTFYNSVTIPDIAQATTANVSITFGSDGSQFSAVWIDFNQNGTFEASEGFLSPGNAGSNGTSIISITIPAGALLGNTRMRVRGGNDSALTTAQACGTSSSGFGETEDYIVNITAPPACNTPTALSVTAVTASSATISWSAAVPAPGVGYEYAVTTSATPPASGTPIAGTTTSVSLSAQTTYYLHVRSECTAGTEYSAWVTSASFTTPCNAITSLPHIEGFDTVGVVPTCWTRALVTGTTNWLPAASNDGVPSPRTGAAFASKAWSGNDNALFISPVYNLTANPTSVARVNVWIYRNATNGLSTDRTAFYVNTTNNLTGATQLLDIPLRTNQAPVVATAGWYNYIAEIPLSYNTGGNFYVIASGTTTSSFSSYSVGFDDYALEFVPTDTPDFVNLQWPVTSTVPAGTATTVYGRVYEAGLTDATSGQAPGILAWVGISPIGSNTNPNTWTTWVPATFNVEVGNDDEYSANIGAALVPGTYYYATRFQLNGGPFVYGGSNGDTVNGGGNFWDGTTYNSGVLTINPNPTQCAINPNPANNATGVPAGNVTFTWGAPASGPTPTSYEVYGGTTSGSLALITTVTTPSVNLTITGYSTVFYWRVVPISTAGGTATGCAEWTFTTQADPFLPYCSTITYTSTVEPITLVNFAGINNSSTNATGGPAIENYISIVGNVNAGQSYTMTLKGNSDGNFTNNYRVFIDFNQDGDFADAGETFNAGSITNSTGLDAATAVSNITIPLSALGGNTRMRVKKLFETTDIDNPCIGGGFGQIEDYTLNVTPLCTSTATWDGTMWSGTPSATAALVFNGNYTHADSSVLEGCSCTINGTSAVSFPSGTLRLQNNLSTIMGSSLVFQSGANFVQVNTTVPNSVLGTFTSNRNSSNILRLDYIGWSSPVVGQNALAFSPLTLTNRFYEYDPLTNAYVSINPSTTSFVAGKGLLVRAPNNWSSTTATAYPGIFTGVPHNGNQTVTVSNLAGNTTNSAEGYNLIGNPYASPISTTDFLNNPNNASLGITTLYFWTNTNPPVAGSYAGTNNYATRNLTAGVAADNSGTQPEDYVQVGQGFVVNAHTSGTVQFNNTMRLATSGGQFFKSNGQINQTESIEKHRVWFDLTSPGFNHNQIVVGYIQGATNASDPLFDAKLFGQSNSVLYSPINNEKFVIQGRALPFVASDVVPLGLLAQTAGSYTIAINSFDGLFTSQDVFLRDNLLNITHDIKNAPYTFASDAGEFNTRFEVVYANALSTVTPTFTENSVVVYTNQLGININAGSTTIDSIKVFDVRGRLLYTKSNVNASETVLENVTSEKQVLLVQITSTDNTTVSKKVIY